MVCWREVENRHDGHRARSVADALQAEVEHTRDGLVMQHVHAALAQVTERGHDQIEVAVEIEIEGTNIGDATNSLQQRSELELVVLELKYAGELDTEVRSLIGSLPGRLSRFSKY